MSVARRIAANAGALAASQSVALALNFVTWAYLARTLEPSQYGILGFGMALLAYFTVVVQLGFDAVVMREGARAPERLPRLAGELTALRLVLCVAAFALYAAVVFALPRPPEFRLALLALGLNLVVLATRLNWAFQAVEEMRPVAVRDSVVAVLNAVAVFALVRRPEQVVMAAVLTAGVPLLGNGWLWTAYRRRFGALRLVFDRVAWGALLRPALPLAASALLIEVYVRMDQVMLEFLYSTETVGLYSAAARFTSLAQLPANVAFGAFFPAVAAVLGSADLMRERGRQLARVLLPIGLVIAAAGPWLAHDALVFVYGEAYAPAAAALGWLLVNTGVIHFNMAIGIPLMAWDLQKPYMWAVLGGAIVNVALNILLIPPFGMVGSAAATLAAQSTVLVLIARLYRRETGELPFTSVLPSLAVAAAAAGVAAAGTVLGAPILLTGPLVVGTAAAMGWRLNMVDVAALRAPAQASAADAVLAPPP
ncbi:MAG TPA: oligosaccharide flippase family protein [Rubricoccaceae bacterium]